MCEDTADPQINNFWPWSERKWGPNAANAGTKVGAQAWRSNTNIASPRDGIPRDANDAATDTIPNNVDSAIPNTVETRRFGMHENKDHYDRCEHTERNKGLYTADQRMRRNDQRATRQNPNGNRNGYECPEERDYYPWWHPSPWIDIAVLSNEGPDEPCTSVVESNGDYVCRNENNVAISSGHTQRCAYYLSNSQNKHGKGFCDANADGTVTDKTNSQAWNQRKWYNNRAACETAGFTWKEISHSDNLNGIDYPVCGQTSFSRVNHLGNAADDDNIDSQNYYADGGKTYLPESNNANRFVWTIPDIPSIKNGVEYFDAGMEESYKSCTLRLRYNISTSDFPQWPEEAMEANHGWADKMVNFKNNTKKNEDDPATPLIQDPYIFTGVGDSPAKGKQFVSLAVNTNQYGRTFQDRSYKFAIKPRPSAESCDNPNDDTECRNADSPKILSPNNNQKIFNLNVRGKRGNIVQTYPSVEYDFVPNRLKLDQNNYIHYQWTGSDYNPRRGCNNGEGGPPDPNDFVSAANANKNSRADRSNIIFMNTMAENVPMDMLGVTDVENADDDTAIATIMPNVPCGSGNTAEKEDCYRQIQR